MVIVKVWGGLGNQLFQYSFGKYLANKLGTTVTYDIRTTNTVKNFTQRSLLLSSFNTSLEIASDDEIDQTKFFKSPKLARAERKLAQLFPSLLTHHIVESNTPKPIADMHFRNDCYYEGYWQSYKYLAPVEALLRKEIILKGMASVAIKDEAAIMQSSPSVSIHVRRGDYLTNPYLISYSMAYYEKAIAYFDEAVPGATFYFFSDDIDWCKENFSGSRYAFVTGHEPFEDMYLMSKCHHHIIANSTFSWWGAWLNESPGKIVIAPKKWHSRHKEDNCELMPENWIKFD